MVTPPLLGAGSRIAIIAPAGPLRGEAELASAIANVRSLGWEPVPGSNVLERCGYFAGSDEQRLSDLNGAIADESIVGIWCARGGYGAMRLLERVDYAALRRRPKALIGFSDITALHAAVGIRAGLVTYHGPTARKPLSAFSRDSLERAVARGADSCGAAPLARTLRSGRARGPIRGGNLALLASLAGTPFAPSFDGAILVLEDVHEPVYRLDRMMQQLLLSGSLRGCRAIIGGQFTDCSEESDDGARRLDDVLAELAGILGIPCIAGAPIGHVEDQWTVPLGCDAELIAEDGSAAVRLILV